MILIGVLVHPKDASVHGFLFMKDSKVCEYDTISDQLVFYESLKEYKKHHRRGFPHLTITIFGGL